MDSGLRVRVWPAQHDTGYFSFHTDWDLVTFAAASELTTVFVWHKHKKEKVVFPSGLRSDGCKRPLKNESLKATTGLCLICLLKQSYFSFTLNI